MPKGCDHGEGCDNGCDHMCHARTDLVDAAGAGVAEGEDLQLGEDGLPPQLNDIFQLGVIRWTGTTCEPAARSRALATSFTSGVTMVMLRAGSGAR